MVPGKADWDILVRGVGATIAVNNVPGVRACLCHDVYSAHHGVKHGNINVLCLGARVIGIELVENLAMAFLNVRFTGEERHRRRLGKVAAIEGRAIQRKPVLTPGGLA